MTPERERLYHDALHFSILQGAAVLKDGGTALDAVKAAVVALENNSLFNAGKGSVFTHDGQHEMDASLMCGKTLTAGAVAGVRHVKNPVLLADLVRNRTDHVFLHGTGAEMLARQFQLEMETDAYFYDDYRHEQWLEVKDTVEVRMDHTSDTDKKFGTVGAVALDQAGDLAAATSTGGMTNKRYNRIGDTPVIGAGTYANNNTCAISCTGHGEYFLRSVVAYDISCLIEYKGMSLKEACEFVVHDKLVKTGGEGGLIALDRKGVPELVFNSEGMYRACMDQDLIPFIAIYK